jgi:hypothetical protein
MLDDIIINRKNFGEYIHVVPFQKNWYVFKPRPFLAMLIEEQEKTNYEVIAPLVMALLKPVSISKDVNPLEVVAEVPKLAEYLKWGCESWEEYVNTNIK